MVFLCSYLNIPCCIRLFNNKEYDSLSKPSKPYNGSIKQAHSLICSLNVVSTLFSVLCVVPDVSKVQKKQQTPSSATVMELVSTNRQGVTKQVKRLQGRLGPGKSKATVKDKRIKSAVGQYTMPCCSDLLF